MFTGIVEELGRVLWLHSRADSAVLKVEGPIVVAGAAPGDSIAVNGCCLTVVDTGASWFTADVMLETLDRTALGRLQPDDRVNLERSVTSTTRLGGHVVQGHVDGTGVILRRASTSHWDTVTIAFPQPLARFIALKGAIAVDGVSLTVSGVEDLPARDGVQPDFSVSLIPTTLERTTLGIKTIGDPVNIEVDVLAKYVARQLDVSRAERLTSRRDALETAPFEIPAARLEELG